MDFILDPNRPLKHSYSIYKMNAFEITRIVFSE